MVPTWYGDRHLSSPLNGDEFQTVMDHAWKASSTGNCMRFDPSHLRSLILHGGYGVMVNTADCGSADTGSIPVSHPHTLVAELVDALDLGSSVARRAGSSPVEGTIET